MRVAHRIDFIDIAKGIGILLVVWAHILLTGFSHKLIYAFHMPLFFIISGMLFRRSKYRSITEFIKHRAKRLLVPFAIYSVVTWLIWAAFRFIRHDEVVSYWDPLLQTIIAKGSGAYMVHNSALWFVPCLFATEILYFLYSRYSDIVKILLSIGCAALSFILGYFFNDKWWFLLPWNFDAALIAVLFYCVGNIFSSKVSGKELVAFSQKHTGRLLCIFAFLCLALFWSAMAFGECSMGSSSYQCNGLVFILRALIGSAACIILSVFISFLATANFLKRYLIREGLLSLDIMSIHIPIKGVVIMALSMIVHQTSDAISSCTFLSAIAFIITMATVDFLVEVISRGKKLYNTRFVNSEN